MNDRKSGSNLDEIADDLAWKKKEEEKALEVKKLPPAVRSKIVGDLVEIDDQHADLLGEGAEIAVDGANETAKKTEQTKKRGQL